MKNYWIIGIVLVVILAGGGYVLTQRGTPSESPTAMQPSETPHVMDDTTASPTGNMATDSATQGTVKEFVVEGNNFKFAPNEMRVKKGDTVKITFKNTGGLHDLVIDEFKVQARK